MFLNRHTQRFTAWLACFAILLVSLAPSVSHALSATNKSASFFAEICTVTEEATWIKTGDSQESKAPSPVKKGLHFEHCPFCSSSAGSIGLPPSAMFQLPILTDRDPKPLLFYLSPRPLFIWASAQSRAPPSL